MSFGHQNDLPHGWAQTTLGAIRLDRSQNVEPDNWADERFELYSVPSYDEGEPDIVYGREIGSNKRTVEIDTILLCKINPRINRVWIVGNYSPYRKIASTEWIQFERIDGIDPRYLRYFMQQASFRDFLAVNASGIGGSLMRINPQVFEQYPLFLPPTSEQYRIVEEIEKQLSRLDVGISGLKRTEINLLRFRASTLNAAIEGRLVQTEASLARLEKRNYESAEQLLTRILRQRREKWEASQLASMEAQHKTPKDDTWRTKYKEPTPPEIRNLPRLPEGWIWATLLQLGELNRGKSRHRPRNDPKSGLNRDFAEYKSALYYKLASQQLNFMREGFEEYLVKRWDGGYVAHVKRLSPNLRMRSRYVSRKDAHEFLRIKVEGVDRLIALGKLKAIVRNNGRSRTVLIERSSLDSVKHELEHSLYIKQVAKMLGICVHRIYEMIECNLLRPRKGEGTDGRSNMAFNSEEIKSLLAAVRGKLIKGSRVTTSGNISFLKALRKLVRVNINIGQFIQLILDGRLRPIGVNAKPGLASLMFSKSDINGYITELERIRLGETFSVPEVAKRLGVGITSAQILITKGIIQIRRQAVKGHYDLRISKSAIDLFNSHYVLPAKLAQQFNTTSSRLTNLIITHGVNPISGPKVDGGKQYVFRRTDIDRMDLGAIWRASASEHISRLNERKLIDARQAAKILDIDRSDVLDLAERGILKLHRHVASGRHKADGPFFSMFTIEKYKAQTIDYSGLVSLTVAAEMLGVSVATLYRYIPKKLLQIALDRGEGRRYFRLDDVKRLIEGRNTLRQQYVTTAEVAAMCKVKKESVHAWIEAGLLRPISKNRAYGL